MAEDLCCSICMVRFNESTRKPLFLVCGHTFCQECLLSIQSRGKLRCPNCNKEDQRLVDALPKNLVAMELIVKGLLQAQQGGEDPWGCQLHPGEQLLYFATRRRAFLCEECVKTLEPGGSVIRIDKKQQDSRLKKYEKLYSESSLEDLDRREAFLSRMEQCIRGEQARASLSASQSYRSALHTLETAHTSEASRITDYYNSQRGHLEAMGAMLDTVRARKQLRLGAEDRHMDWEAVARLTQNVAARDSQGAGRVVLPQIETSDLCSLLTSTRHKAFQESGGQSDPTEHRISRFLGTGLRWGVFPARNQVEAVAFQTSRPVHLTAVTVGNAYFPRETMKCVSLELLEGRKTDGKAVGGVTDIPLSNWEKLSACVKISFSRPIHVVPFRDYTIKAKFDGSAGLFRGHSPLRTVTGAKGVDFVFSQADFSSTEYENGKNLSDGPLLELYYTLGDESGVSVARPLAPAAPLGKWQGTAKLTVKSTIRLIGIAIVGSMDRTIPAVVTKLTVFTGKKGVYNIEKPVVVTLGETQTEYLLSLQKEIVLHAGKTYEIAVKMKGRGGLALLDTASIGSDALLASFETLNKVGVSSATTPFARLLLATDSLPHKYGKRYAALGEVPTNFAEKAGGDTDVHLYADLQPETDVRNGPNGVKFEVSHRIGLTKVCVGAIVDTETARTYIDGLQIYRNRELVYFEGKTEAAKSATDPRQCEVLLAPPIVCEPNAVYSVLVLRSEDRGAVYVGVGRLEHVQGPEEIGIRVTSEDGSVTALGCVVEKDEDVTGRVQEAICKVWEGSKPEDVIHKISLSEESPPSVHLIPPQSLCFTASAPIFLQSITLSKPAKPSALSVRFALRKQHSEIRVVKVVDNVEKARSFVRVQIDPLRVERDEECLITADYPEGAVGCSSNMKAKAVQITGVDFVFRREDLHQNLQIEDASPFREIFFTLPRS